MARQRYVPLGLHFAHGNTGTTLMAKLGAKGLLVWVCLIAAAKRGGVQGQYIHVSDQETWTNFGLQADPPEFTFESFLTVTGRLKQTSRTRHGRLLYVTLTRWPEWNKEWKRDQDATQKASKRDESNTDIPATDERHNGDGKALARADCDCDCEGETTTERDASPAAANGAAAVELLTLLTTAKYTGPDYHTAEPQRALAWLRQGFASPSVGNVAGYYRRSMEKPDHWPEPLPGQQPTRAPLPLVKILDAWIRNVGRTDVWSGVEFEIDDRERRRNEKITNEQRLELHELWQSLQPQPTEVT